MALAAEAAARSVSPLIKNSEGAGVSASHGQFFSANTAGFSGGYPYSRHWLSVAPIASGATPCSAMTGTAPAAGPRSSPAPQDIGRYAARRALSRLGAKRFHRAVAVIFEPTRGWAHGVLGSCTEWSALYRRASFLLDAKGQQIFPDHIEIDEDPFIPAAAGSAPSMTRACRLSTQTRRSWRGPGYFLSMYTARKLSMQPTGHAAAPITCASAVDSLSQRRPGGLDQTMGRGLLVTEVMGQGVNA